MRVQTSLRRKATATVEFAIIAPILAALMLGMIEVTRAIQVKNYLTDTARSGCRIAIEPGSSNASVTSSVHAILNSHGIDPGAATITILVNDAVADLSSARKYDRISVRVAVPINRVNWVTPLFLGSTAIESETLVMMHN